MNEYTTCPQCENENPADNRFCGRCGTSLASTNHLVPRRDNSSATAVRSLPSKLGPTGKALAMGLATLAAEAGLLWLRRRLERVDGPPLHATPVGPKPMVPVYPISHSLEEVLYVWVQEGDHQGRILAKREIRSFGTIGSTDVRG